MKEISYLYELSIRGVDRIRVQAVVDRGEIQSFVVQYETNIASRWCPIVRYDTAHGFAHRDMFHAGMPTEKQPLPVDDFNRAFTFAVKDIKTQWRYYRERYEREI